MRFLKTWKVRMARFFFEKGKNPTSAINSLNVKESSFEFDSNV